LIKVNHEALKTLFWGRPIPRLHDFMMNKEGPWVALNHASSFLHGEICHVLFAGVRSRCTLSQPARCDSLGSPDRFNPDVPGALLALFQFVALLTDPLAKRVIGCAIEVHRHLGPGLLESAYQRCLTYELSLSQIAFVADRPLPLAYKGLELHCGYRLDIVVDDKLILELKAVERLLPIHQAQMITYLRLLSIRQGLLINFNVPRLVDGVKSVLL
jgi:GxxExxY protein